MEIKVGPISSHSFEGILLVCLLWLGVVWLLVQYLTVPTIVILLGTLGVLSWACWIIFQSLATSDGKVSFNFHQRRSTDDTPPTICPRCQAKDAYRPQYTTGGGWRVSHYVCENCGRKQK